MKTRSGFRARDRSLALAFATLFVASLSAGAEGLTAKQLENLEVRLNLASEVAQAKQADIPAISASGWTLRSQHLCFGLPRIVDRRHDFDPDGQGVRTGISVLVREGFVIAHFDRMRVPLFACQRWTKADYHRMQAEADYGRPWKEDAELPVYARCGTSYDGNETDMDRGHMARHETNKAWGEDSSKAGCLMSNSAPQRKAVNRGAAWRELEDMLRDAVDGRDAKAEVIWIITGTLFRGKDEAPDSTAESDFQGTQTITTGFGVPKATYKVVGWFDENGRFQARGYVFEQDDREPALAKHLKKIDEIERRAGVDFFPDLRDAIEDAIESAEYETPWGET